MPIVGVLLLSAIAICQIAALTAGLEFWLELHRIAAVPLAIIVAAIPGLGQAGAFLGAMWAWDWTWWQAGLVVVSPLVVILALKWPWLSQAHRKLPVSAIILRFLHGQ
jgi:hypothetical protein